MSVPEKEDAFDFRDLVFDEGEAPASSEAKAEEKKPERNVQAPSVDSQVKTSYILVNVLLNLLVRKGLIHQHEVNALVAELHKEYMDARKGSGNNGNQ